MALRSSLPGSVAITETTTPVIKKTGGLRSSLPGSTAVAGTPTVSSKNPSVLNTVVGGLKATPAFLGNMAKEIVVSVPRALATPFATTYQDITQLRTGVRPDSVSLPFIGEVGIANDPTKAAGQTIGRVTDLLTAIPMFGAAKAGVAGAKEIAKVEGKELAKKVIAQRLKAMPIDGGIGALYGVATGLQDQKKSANDLLFSAAIGGFIGATAPIALGATIGAMAKTAKFTGTEVGKGMESVAKHLDAFSGRIKNLPEDQILYRKNISEIPVDVGFLKGTAGNVADLLRKTKEFPDAVDRLIFSKYADATKFRERAKKEGIDPGDIENWLQQTKSLTGVRSKNRTDEYFKILDAYRDVVPQVTQYRAYLNDLDRLRNGDDITAIKQIVDGKEVVIKRKVEDVNIAINRLFSTMKPEEQQAVHEAQKHLNRFMDDELLAGVEAGSISAEKFKMIKEAHPNYLPNSIADYFEEGVQGAQGAKGKSFNVTESSIQVAKGSERELENPHVSVMRMIRKNSENFEKNKTANRVMESIKPVAETMGFKVLRDSVSVKERGMAYARLSELAGKIRENIKLKIQEAGISKTKFGVLNDSLDDSFKVLDEFLANEGVNAPAGNGLVKQREQSFQELLTNIDDTFNRLRSVDENSIQVRDNFDNILASLSDEKKKLFAATKQLEDIKIKDIDIPKGFTKFSFLKDGIKEEWLIPMDLGIAMKQIKPEAVEAFHKLLTTSFLGKTLKGFAGALRTVSTQRNPIFVASNFFRDVQTQAVNAPFRVTPKDFFEGFLTSVGASRGKANELYQKAESGTALTGTIFKEFTDPEKEVVKRLSNFTKNGQDSLFSKTVSLAKGVVTGRVFEDAGQVLEETTRLAVFSRAMKNGLSTEESAKLARNVTVDFGKSGMLMEDLNSIIPFLNARTQGLANLATRAKDDPFGFSRQIMYTAVWPATLLTAHNIKYDSYQNIPDYDKRKYWVYMLGQTAGTTLDGTPMSVPLYIKIPKGEAQQSFSNITERALTIGLIEHPDSTKNFLKNIFADTSPITDSSILPPGIQQFIELKTNHSFFKDSQIESDYTNINGVWKKTDTLAPRDVVQYNTSEVAKVLGGVLNWSPVKIDYVIKTGVLNDLLRVGDIAAESWVKKDQAEQEKNLVQKLSEMPITRSIFGAPTFSAVDQRQREFDKQQAIEANTAELHPVP